MRKAGTFIAFEGIDGSGKSSQLDLLASRLETEGHQVYRTFEPTDSRIGSTIRAILKGEYQAEQLTIAALFAADRLHHILNQHDGILKKLSEGYIVLCDRYYFSSYAYHSTYMDMDWVISINAKSTGLLKPDVNIFIDVPPETAMNRIQQNRAHTELYETHEQLIKVYANYQQAFEKLKAKENIIRIEGERTQSEIAADVWRVVAKMI